MTGAPKSRQNVPFSLVALHRNPHNAPRPTTRRRGFQGFSASFKHILSWKPIFQRPKLFSRKGEKKIGSYAIDRSESAHER